MTGKQYDRQFKMAGITICRIKGGLQETNMEQISTGQIFQISHRWEQTRFRFPQLAIKRVLFKKWKAHFPNNTHHDYEHQGQSSKKYVFPAIQTVADPHKERKFDGSPIHIWWENCTALFILFVGQIYWQNISIGNIFKFAWKDVL